MELCFNARLSLRSEVENRWESQLSSHWLASRASRFAATLLCSSGGRTLDSSELFQGSIGDYNSQPVGNRIARILNSGGKFLGAQITCKPTQGHIQAWKDELRKKIPKGQQVFAFTDGSTDVKLDPNVSGAGICLVSNNEVVWEGGFRVQTNGNNYVAEYMLQHVSRSE